ncbi:MAG TPA: FAD binding domain-containing protein, partial [Bacteroidota bacterium]|nr:FAD binding domain-containing protein [Bacteroidota bacterium]
AGPGLAMCTAVFFSDLAPLLIALDAVVEIRSRAGARTIPLAELYSTDGGAHLAFGNDEIMTAVLVPGPGKDVRFCHMKFSLRGAIDFPVANVGVRVGIDPSGACTGAKVVVGAVQTCPAEIRGAGEILKGAAPGPDAIEEAARAASAGVNPFPNAYESIGYRKKIVGVLVRRALKELLSPDRHD